MALPAALGDLERDFTEREVKFITMMNECGWRWTPAMRIELGRQAGYLGLTNSQVLAQTGRIRHKLTHNRQFQLAMQEEGVTFKTIAEALAGQLNAKHPQFPAQKDNLAINRAIELAGKYYDLEPPKRQEITETKTESIHITIEVLDRIKKATSLSRGTIIDAEFDEDD